MDTISQAFESYPRARFLPPSVRSWAPDDRPLPIGHGQTCSQPSTVRRMLEWLDVHDGQRVCDVGSGSGWTTALLSALVGDAGHVVAVELVQALVRFGRDNCLRAGVENVEFHRATGVFGWPQRAPYDRILVSASATELPAELLDQLAVDGKLVIPVRHDILEITKRSDNEYDTILHGGFVFVPLLPRL